MKTNKLVSCPQCGGFGFTSTPVSTDYEITVCRAKTCELCHGAGVIEAPMPDLKPCPCKGCIVRGRFAIGLDMHFWGDDCPYKCDAYETWKHRAGDKSKHD